MNDKKVAIITVNYNNDSVTDDFLISLKESVKDSYQVFIADLSDQIKDKVLTDENAVIIRGENKGYAHGINLGIKQAIEADFDKFIVINNDTLVGSGFTTFCFDSIQKNSKTIIGGKIFYAKGFEYHKDRYPENERGKVLWYAGGRVDWKNVITHHIGVDEVDRGQYDAPVETEFVTGCLMCFDRQVYEAVGLWDESYFLYYEDADWCERAKRSGVKLVYDPSIVIWHKNAQSTGGPGSKLHQNYQEKNRIKFGLKYAPLRTKLHLLKNIIL